MKKDNYQKGVYYEKIAAQYLQQKGYQIIQQNYRTSYGEIDMIAMDDTVLVFVEIKYRQNENYGTPSMAVDRNKQRRISRVAMAYYQNHGYVQEIPCRFDVISIQGKTITHYENAFEYVER